MATEPVNIFEYEELARERIEKGHYDFIAGGATDEITIRRTRAVLDSIMLRPQRSAFSASATNSRPTSPLRGRRER